MGWCENFKKAVKDKTIIIMNGFYFDDYEIKYCPFCGATLTMEDI